MRLRLLQLKNWQKRQLIKHHSMVYLQHHFAILMHLIFTLLQTTAQKVRHIGSGCSLYKQWGKATTSFTVTFPVSFSEIPVVSVQEIVTTGEIGEIQAMPRQAYLTADGMSISKARIAGSGTDNATADWFALGFIK